MASYNAGKDQVIDYIMGLYSEGYKKEYMRILDVGACDGKWAALLRQAGYDGILDAVEIFTPNVIKILTLYDNVFAGDIFDYRYAKRTYDVAIFGDVIEHMEILDAQFVLGYAQDSCGEVIVGVPYLYHQDAIYGNEWERHIQDDLTHELFMERYPGFERFVHPQTDYGYYRKARK